MKLTNQEHLVLIYITLGYSDKEIGKKMKIQYSTVRTYIDRGILKMGARNRTHAAFKYMMKLSPEVFLEKIKGLKEVL